MSFLLHIDTAVSGASLCLSAGEQVLGVAENTAIRDSASWIHPGIQKLLHENGVAANQLSAVSVSSGPGSYTGLRVGMATAKGLCFALGLPLITLNTLQVMAHKVSPSNGFCCPMIDARRMEVFTGIYGPGAVQLLPDTNLVLEDNSFAEWLEKDEVLFCGNGSGKFREICKHPSARFSDLRFTAADGVPLALDAFNNGHFADLAYSEPRYGKAFFTPARKQSS